MEASEPPEVALAREEVNLLLAEQQKTAALKVRERDDPPWQWCLLSEPGNPLRVPAHPMKLSNYVATAT